LQTACAATGIGKWQLPHRWPLNNAPSILAKTLKTVGKPSEGCSLPSVRSVDTDTAVWERGG